MSFSQSVALKCANEIRTTGNLASIAYRRLSRILLECSSQIAPMSATHNADIAVQYSASQCATILRILTKDFTQRGADIAFLSAFPAEQESLYPPLTFLRSVKRPIKQFSSLSSSRGTTTGADSPQLQASTHELVTATGVMLTLIDVEPQN